METVTQRHVPPAAVGGQGSFHDFSPKLSQKKVLPLQDGGAESDDGVMRRGRPKEARSLPPLQSGGAALLLQLKVLKQVEVEGGGARALWRAVFSGNRKEKKKRGRTLPQSAERVKQGTTNRRRVTGDDGIKKYDSNRVMSQ